MTKRQYCTLKKDTQSQFTVNYGHSESDTLYASQTHSIRNKNKSVLVTWQLLENLSLNASYFGKSHFNFHAFWDCSYLILEFSSACACVCVIFTFLQLLLLLLLLSCLQCAVKYAFIQLVYLTRLNLIWFHEVDTFQYHKRSSFLFISHSFLIKCFPITKSWEFKMKFNHPKNEWNE